MAHYNPANASRVKSQHALSWTIRQPRKDRLFAGTAADVNGVVKAWVNFNGIGAATINDSFNVASITRNGTGDYTVT